MIPKILHQTWKVPEVPEKWKAYQRSWRERNPDWEYCFWSDTDCLMFVEKHFPQYLKTFLALPYGILRADAFRYLVLFKFGGLYADMDVECLQAVSALFSAQDRFVVGVEPAAHVRSLAKTPMLGNAVLASEPLHPFLARIVERIFESGARKPADVLTQQDVLETTGPRMLQDVFSHYKGSDVRILESHVFYPVDVEQSRAWLINGQGESAKRALVKSGSFAIHYWDNTWVSNLSVDLVNEQPYQIEGYVFFPGKDSWGFDFGNKGRDVKQVAALWAREPKVLGFNTDGFAKYYIHPRFRWKPISRSPQANEGLYIKAELADKPLCRLLFGFGSRRFISPYEREGF